MDQPSINISFTTAANTAVQRAQKGVVAIILEDSTEAVQGSHVLKSESDIPAALTATNKAYIKQAFIGNVSKPKKVLLYVVASSADNLSTGTAWLATQRFNWLVGPHDCDATKAAELATFIAAQRALGRLFKAVLPNKAAADPAVVNFTTDSIVVGSGASAVTYATAGYCARIAGLIAGTPLQSSITYAVLPEVTSVEQLSASDANTACAAGKLILMHDGVKVKAGRGVTSLVTPGVGQTAGMQKIKIMETMDLVTEDVRTVIEDTFIGKYANTYDNRVLLVASIGAYLGELVAKGILNEGSTCDLDVDAINTALTTAGTDTSEMDEAAIRAADTGDDVYITITLKIPDAIEDVTVKIRV